MYYVVNIFIIQAFPTLSSINVGIIKPCWKNLQCVCLLVLISFILLIQNLLYSSKVFTDYWMGHGVEVRKVFLALLFSIRLFLWSQEWLKLSTRNNKLQQANCPAPHNIKMCVSGILNNYVCFIELSFTDLWHAIPVRVQGACPSPH